MYILPPDTLFHSLALPPTDPRFPSLGLLPALCALGATMVPLPPHCDDYWREAPTASAYHFRQAKLHINSFKYNTVLDDARAALLLTVYSFAAEQFMEVWQLVGLACRSLAPAGLNVSMASLLMTETEQSRTACAEPMRTAFKQNGRFSWPLLAETNLPWPTGR